MRIRRARLRAVLAAACGGALACSDSPVHPIGCSGTITIEVGPSPTSPGKPSFAWAPRCGVTELTVFTVPPLGAAGVLVWDIAAPERAQIGPPVTYGLTPEDATVRHAPQALVAGVTYRVTVASIVGGDGVGASGSTTFSR